MVTKEEVISRVKKEEIKHIQLIFTDIYGNVKGLTAPASKLEETIERGAGVDGSSLGLASVESSDLRVVPDIETLKIVTREGIKTATFLCNIYDSKMRRHSGDPRFILENVLRDARNMGFDVFTKPELEFYLFKLSENGLPTSELFDIGRYGDTYPLDKGEFLRKKVVDTLWSLGIDYEVTHHENGCGQHEIELYYVNALTSADWVVLTKRVLKCVAMEYGAYASFMPKPFREYAGSGLHVHQYLRNSEGNAFYDKKGKWELSENALHYIGGLVAHAKEICAVLCATVNSYKRLVPGYEAPVYICWAVENRSAMIRVPGGRGESTRVEMRCPDPSGNIYLQMAVMIAAGLEGIKNKIEPPEPVEMNLYERCEGELQKKEIALLPTSLSQALDEMENGTLAKKVLSEFLFQRFIELKRAEALEYSRYVTNWERERYLQI
ncbi:MAG: glutamine synthetase family protein [Thermoplasmata archaeon]